MSLHTFERSLLKLYSKPQEINQYLADEHEWCLQNSLTASESTALKQIPKDQLIGFQKMLHRKSLRVALLVLSKNKKMVALSSLHENAPVLLWEKHASLQSLHLSPALYSALHYCAREKLPLTLGNLASHIFKTPEISFTDLTKFISLVFREKLLGRSIFIPLIL